MVPHHVRRQRGPGAGPEGRLQAPGRPDQAGLPVRPQALLPHPARPVPLRRQDLRADHHGPLRHQRPLPQQGQVAGGRGDHPARRQHDGGRVRRRRAEGGQQGPGPVGLHAGAGDGPVGRLLDPPVRGELLDEAGKKVLLDTPEARAGLEWVYNCQAKFQLIDDLYRTDSQSTMFESSGKLAAISQTPGWPPSTRSRARSGSSSTWGSPSSPGAPRRTARRGSGRGWG